MATLVDDPDVLVDDTTFTLAGVPFATPAERTVVIPAESRTLTVPEA